jgi:hypothetical protein
MMEGGALGLPFASASASPSPSLSAVSVGVVMVLMVGRTRGGGDGDDDADTGAVPVPMTGGDAGRGILRSRLPLFWPAAAPAKLPIVGLGLRLLKLPMGLAKPLPKVELVAGLTAAGETTAIWSDW